MDKSINYRESGTKPRGIRNILAGNQEHIFGVSGTARSHIQLKFDRILCFAQPSNFFNLDHLTYLTATVPDNPIKLALNLEAQAHRGLSLPKEGKPFLD